MSAPRLRLPIRTWVAVCVLLVLLTVVNLMFMPDGLEISATSYGHSQFGFGAVYQLLEELDFGVTRSRLLYTELSQEQPLWLIAPELDVADGGEDDRDEDDPQDRKGDKKDRKRDKSEGQKRLERFMTAGEAGLLAELHAYVEAGGTAVLIGASPAVLDSFGLALTDDCVAVAASLTGPLAPRPRKLDGEMPLPRFAPNAGETLLAVDGEPFATLLSLGSGHLVAVAGAAPLRNENLDKADHALLAVDLARAFGAPRFDERSHGLRGEITLASALGAARVLLLLTGFGLLTLLWLWYGRSVPTRALAAAEGMDPSLLGYVESLAYLYALKGPRDAPVVYQAYVHGLRHRLRRAVYGRGRGSDLLLSQRLARELEADQGLYACLEGRLEPRNEAELERSVRRMEGYVATAAWHAKRRAGGAKRA